MTGEVYGFLAMMFAYSNGVVDFWIYSYMNRSFRRVAGRVFMCCTFGQFSRLSVCGCGNEQTAGEPISTQTGTSSDDPQNISETPN